MPIANYQLPLENMHHIPVQGYDAQRRVIYWNQASEQLYGYRAEEALGNTLEALIIPEQMRQHVVNAIKNWVAGGAPVTTQSLTLKHKDGSPVRVVSSHTLYMGRTGPEIYRIDMALDGQTKPQQWAIRQVRHEADLYHRNELEEIVPQISTRFLSRPIEQIDGSIDWALQRLGGFTQSARCYLILLSEDGQQIHRTHEWGAEGIAPRSQDLQTVASSELTSIVHLGKHPQPYWIDQAKLPELSELERQWFAQGLLHSGLSLPIVYNERLHGFLGMDDPSSDRHRPDAAELRLLQVAADIIGAALARQALEMRLRYEANHDTLTGAFNRRWFRNMLDHETQQSEIHGNDLALIFFDIDHFKSVNDQHGYHVGDQVLCQLVALVNQRIRRSDVLARWGGEEFILLLPETSREDARHIAEMLRQVVGTADFKVPGGLTISLGITYYESGDNADRLIRRADAALYAAKNQGRNRSITHGLL